MTDESRVYSDYQIDGKAWTIPVRSHTDLVVCGAGAIGLSIAWEASRRGLTVRVIDKGDLGRGASWAGAGILPPGATVPVNDPLESLRAYSHHMFPQWCAELESESGIDVGFRRSGGYYLARTAVEKATLSAHQSQWNDFGIQYERLNSRETRARVPWLNQDLGGEIESWYFPDEHQIRNPRYVKALIDACAKRRVLLHPYEEMTAVEPKGGSLRVDTDREHYTTDRVCFASGAWTPLTLYWLPKPISVYPVRGQMLLLRSSDLDVSAIINEGHRYIVPRGEGLFLVGSCEEEVGYDLSTTDEVLAELRSWSVGIFPTMQEASIERVWSGLRPASIDGLPFLGSIAGSSQMFVATGHYRHGLHLSPITARCMVDLMTHISPPIDLNPFRLLRGRTSSTESR